mmetsp:Transcript_30468/g.81136  ORF Transcript_30468/g.81136 Transcript_30468/m.81136 type:complete len:240 (+) Transcript_30468:600-1319(+)
MRATDQASACETRSSPCLSAVTAKPTARTAASHEGAWSDVLNDPAELPAAELPATKLALFGVEIGSFPDPPTITPCPGPPDTVQACAGLPKSDGDVERGSVRSSVSIGPGMDAESGRAGLIAGLANPPARLAGAGADFPRPTLSADEDEGVDWLGAESKWRRKGKARRPNSTAGIVERERRAAFRTVSSCAAVSDLIISASRSRKTAFATDISARSRRRSFSPSERITTMSLSSVLQLS